MRLSASASWGSSLAKLCSNGCTFFLGVSGMSACKWWSSVKNVYAHKYYVEYAPLTNPGIRKHDILYIDMSGQILCRSYTWAQTSTAEGSVSGLLFKKKTLCWKRSTLENTNSIPKDNRINMHLCLTWSTIANSNSTKLTNKSRGLPKTPLQKSEALPLQLRSARRHRKRRDGAAAGGSRQRCGGHQVCRKVGCKLWLLEHRQDKSGQHEVSLFIVCAFPCPYPQHCMFCGLYGNVAGQASMNRTIHSDPIRRHGTYFKV